MGSQNAEKNTNTKDDKVIRRKIQDMKGTVRRIEALIEVCVLVFSYHFVWNAYYKENNIPFFYGDAKVLLDVIYAILIFVLFILCDSFKYGHRKFADILVSQWISLFIVNFITYLQLSLTANHLISLFPMLFLVVVDYILSFIMIYVFTAIYHQLYVPQNMLMIYGNEKALALKFKMDTRPDKYCITKIISYEKGYDIIKEEIATHDAVIINDVPAQTRNDILKYCYQNEVRTYLVPKISDIISRGAEDITLFDTPLLLVRGSGLTLTQRKIKRLIDIVLSLIALIPATPIMILVAVCIKIEDHGPIFFHQKRVTEGGRIFDILKFRSMIIDAEKEGKSIPATDNDPRITRVGKVIRAIHIDELPQLFNILKGDMSIVGPRPERVEHVEMYTKEVPEFALRTRVKGGLTGYAQIYGKYNTSAYDKLRLDLMYIENYSLFLDIKLMLMTIQILLKKENTEGFYKAAEKDTRRKVLITAEESDRE